MAVPLPARCDVVVVGAGVSGASAVFHLSRCPGGPRDVCLLDSGIVGRGSTHGKPLVPHAQVEKSDRSDLGTPHKDNVFTFAKSSGTAVFDNPSQSVVKMIVNVFPCSAQEFIAHHGRDGARSYLRLAYLGLCREQTLATQVLQNPSSQMTQLGSLYVCLEEDVVAFADEFHLLQSLGAQGIELWEKSKVQATAGPSFALGIFFPHDAIIDSSAYAQGLVYAAVETGRVRLFDECSPVTSVDTVGNTVQTTLRDSTVITSEHAVVATGGLLMDRHLGGILKPCWSYLVSIPEPQKQPMNQRDFRLQSPNSVNFFTWKFTHDWCLTNGHLRCSGEDHFSALKPPRALQRCAALTAWTIEQLPYLQPSASTYASRYGIYSETPDHCPLVGTAHPNSRVCYLVGCNAWGQASMSFSASLVPALLGYAHMTSEEAELFKVLNIRRFALLEAVLGTRDRPSASL
eukprot:m.187712 g.187712  ORF g.187712 m.187712 type:complete len:459 (+) comp18507_c0_seq2:123-1499(+)